MKEKRKISLRKILQAIVTIMVSACCITAMVSAARIEGDEKAASVAVHIINDKKYHFIEQKEIMDLAINSRHIDVTNTPLSKLDIHSMEQALLADPWIAAAEVYIDNGHVLHLYVTQRVPVARLFQQNKTSYYLDTTLSAMPLSKNYIYYTTIFTNVPDLKNDSAGMALKKQIVTLSRTLQADSFWNAQVSQVIVDSDGTFELMPVLGNQRILFGNLTGMKEKLNNLFIFYKDVLNHIGWDKYDKLDVRFNGQVVASPSLPYKGPTDKAVGNMNWIKSIIESGGESDAGEADKTPEAAPMHILPTGNNKPTAKKGVNKALKPPQKSIAKGAAGHNGKSNYSAKAQKQKIKPIITKKEKKTGNAKKGKDKNSKGAKGKGKEIKGRKSNNSGKNGKDKKAGQKKPKQVKAKYVYPDKNDQ